MVIGKTSTSISKTELFQRYSEVEVLKAAFPQITSIPCRINSPFRKDSHPSFSIYMDNNQHIRFKDFGEADTQGNILDFLCLLWKCSFHQVFDKIIDLMQKENSQELTIKPKQMRVLTRKEANEQSKVQVTVRPWHDYDYEYWASYGIERKWLHYADIHPISHKIITKKVDNSTRQYIFPADKFAYCFLERKEGNLQLKIYQPYNTKGFKWCSKMDGSVIGLWTKIPQQGEKVIICSSLKDALCISCQLHIPALCLQGEGYSMSPTAIQELKRRYKHIYISFDTDSPGIADARKLSAETGFQMVLPDLGSCKDYSDYYKSLTDKSQFQQLKSLFP